MAGVATSGGRMLSVHFRSTSRQLQAMDCDACLSEIRNYNVAWMINLAMKKQKVLTVLHDRGLLTLQRLG